MKIIYLHQYFNTPSMSGGTRSYEMARRLVAAGHEVHMITSWKDESKHTDWYYEEIDGINVHWLPIPYSNLMSYTQRIKAFIKYALKAGKKAINIGGDVVFATSTPLTIAIPGIKASKKLKIPMVFEVRDLWPELPIAIGALKNPLTIYAAKYLEKVAYKNSSKVIALSPGMAEGVLKLGFNKENIEIIPNSSDLELFAYDQNKSDKFLEERPELIGAPFVLYAGTLGLINGVSYLAQLASESLKQKIVANYVVIGRGFEWEKVKKEAEDLGVLGKNFFMYPAIPKTELVGAFSAATISTSLFVDMKEMEANSANKFFDGLAASKPIAINYGGWHKKLLESKQAGICLNRDTKVAIGQLADLLSDDDKLTVHAINARKLAEDQFSRDILAEKLEKTLLAAAISNQGSTE